MLPKVFYRRIAFSFLGLASILFVCIILLTLRHATVTIVSRLLPVETVFVVPFVAEGGEKPVGGVVGTVVEAHIQAERSFPVAEGVEVPGVATGRVRVVNTYSKDQPLVAKTRLLSPEGLLFRLQKGITVPAGESRDVEVYADQLGKESEIGITQFTIPGLWKGLQEKIYAESLEPMKGGTKKVTKVTSGLIDQAKKEIQGELFTLAREKFMKEPLGEGSMLLAVGGIKDTITVEGEADSSVAELPVKGTLTAVGVWYTREEVNQLAEKKLLEEESFGLTLRKSVEPTVEVLRYDPEKKTGELRVVAQAHSILTPEAAFLSKDRFLGMQRDSVEAYLGRFTDRIESFSIDIRPRWGTSSLPRLTDRLQIIVEESKQKTDK